MARYTGPTFKKSRRYSYSLLENNKEFLKGKKRTTVPGEHGDARRRKLSNYGEHLYEKQKCRFMYGLSDKQLKRTFERAKKIGEGTLGENLILLLETRLDNVVYRLGFANTRRQSRQFVNHGLILVNGNKVDIPSYKVKINDKISLKSKLHTNEFVKTNIDHIETKSFVKVDKDKFEGELVRLPLREEVAQQINENLIVEYYNK